MSSNKHQIILLISAILISIVSLNRAAESVEADVAQIDGEVPSTETADLVIQNYLEKISMAQKLRKQMHNQLNILNHINSLTSKQQNDKFLVNAVFSQMRKTFNEFDTILDEFIPNEHEVKEIISSFKLINDAVRNEPNQDEITEEEEKIEMPKRNQDWLKRNAYNKIAYNKIAVIRNGKNKRSIDISTLTPKKYFIQF